MFVGTDDMSQAAKDTPRELTVSAEKIPVSASSELRRLCGVGNVSQDWAEAGNRQILTIIFNSRSLLALLLFSD